MGQIAHSGAAVVVFHGEPMQSELAHLRPQLAGEPIVAIDICGERRNALLGELGDRRPQCVDVIAESEIEVFHAVILVGSS
jgi:hypothetical protein